ncbi:hypothetical protein C0708_23890 (plasmid) [Aeromonas caviae]|uniref:Uncharacterized protein n=1 Tax=Aeromonas taiwanensis TaxID=633417 RepID=A0A5F0K8W2_9GAMM|nr:MULTISPECIES: hypothetical protein [Aeromonas]QLI59312.1 hypothetical protein C0708_23890 [Aeromonas caviae]MBC8691078.1 hypothetical protein [Aeromonas hydrophila]TFF73687.1 hypothetical protein DRM93_14420 [Aeromonas taiwanensis]TFF74577.1 hypothetical protein DRM95_14710 [Aeromonas taiwanensis]TFF77695.1 hypothetical protein DRM94_14420 [Aeromonas taiwanensis]
MANDNNKPKDPWYNPLQMPNGATITGCAAFNRRVKEQGGMQEIVKAVAIKAGQAAAIAAVAAYEAEHTALTPQPSPLPGQPTANQPGHTPGNLH